MRALLALLALAASASLGAATPQPPEAMPCPAGWPAGSSCHLASDADGAWYAIGIPPNWNREALIVQAHGGPDLDQNTPKRVKGDLARWAIAGRAGHAWIATSYRSGGYGWTRAGEDVERARELFVRHFGAARRTILHGQSYGGGVAAKLAERMSALPRNPYDGVLLTSGMLGGGRRYLEFRFDLRVVYEAVCANHPRADEPQYPVWLGLPPESTMTLADLAARVNECTGVRLPAAQRSDSQRRRLADIVNVIHVREDSLLRHMQQSTWLFRDLMQRELGGSNPFDNTKVRYRGSSDDDALNAAVARYAADPQAVAALDRDSAPSGEVKLPVLTLHAIDDPTAFVELESAYRDVLRSAGRDALLVQVFTDEHEHSYLSDAEYVAAFEALLAWIDRGDKPSPQSIAARCARAEAAFGKGCYVVPDYVPAPLVTRVAPRP
jgi:alpha-beta hydrolase superfamily lysophospholipase